MHRRFALVLAFAVLLPACTGVSDLGKAPAPFTGAEGAAVRTKVDAAVAAKKFADAWNLEAQAGTDRTRLETIALASLEADEGPYEAMFAQLRTKFGGLSPEARGRVSALTAKELGLKHWTRAVEAELAAADDAPAYAGAWRVYEQTPPDEALAVLDALRKARKDHDSAAAAPKSK